MLFESSWGSLTHSRDNPLQAEFDIDQRWEIGSLEMGETRAIDVVGCQNEVVLDPFIQCLVLAGLTEEIK